MSLNLKEKLDQFSIKLAESFQAAKNGASIKIDELWKILQLAVVQIVQFVEDNAENKVSIKMGVVTPVPMTGEEKKAAAMDAAEKFYDLLYITIDIPYMPGWLRRLLHPYAKALFMKCVSGSIDATVETLKRLTNFKKG